MYIENFRLILVHPKMKWVYISLLVLYPLLLIFSYLGSSVGSFDESIQLVGGMLVQNGNLPHRDFWTMYPPLNYYMNAMVFSILGTSVISARILQALFFVVVVVCIAWHFTRHVRSSTTFAMLISFVAVLIIGKTFKYSYWNSLALGFLGLLFYLQTIRLSGKSRIPLLLISGFLIALSCLSKLNFGIYFAFAVVTGEIREVVLALRKDGKRDGVRKSLLSMVCFLSPILLCSAIFLISYRIYLSETITQILLFPANHLEQHRIISFSSSSHPRYILEA